MFTYYQCYMPGVWEGYVKRGMADGNTGIRFAQNKLLPENLKFNALAKEGGTLWNLVKENNYPFYIDRLQGGGFFEPYPFDMKLVNRWRELLGDRFGGFQMHEWMSNYRSDLEKTEKGGCTEWTEKAIIAAVNKVYPYSNLFLESMAPEELTEFGKPESAEEFLRISEKLFSRRMKQTDGMLIPCDSGAMAYGLEFAAGAKTVMPEIGWQTKHTRVQISYARGMARAYGCSFGAYYEPWGGGPFSTCCCHREGKNEWGITSGGDFPFESKGENGGSSRSLQMRMHLYAYFSGAAYMSEEWGLANTFYDWENFDLSPYGKVKYDFLQLVKKYPDVGQTYAPVGIVLNKNLPVVRDIENTKDVLFDYPISGSFAKAVRTAQQGLREIYYDTRTEMLGSEARPFFNTTLPDAFDIIHEDKTDALEKYDYLIDLTGENRLSEKYKCISVGEAEQVLREKMPCFVQGNVHWFVNRRKNGWLLIMLNHSGISRNVRDGETVDGNADATVTVTLKKGNLRGLEGENPVSTGEQSYKITVPAGGWFLGEFGE